MFLYYMYKVPMEPERQVCVPVLTKVIIILKYTVSS